MPGPHAKRGPIYGPHRTRLLLSSQTRPRCSPDVSPHHFLTTPHPTGAGSALTDRTTSFVAMGGRKRWLASVGYRRLSCELSVLFFLSRDWVLLSLRWLCSLRWLAVDKRWAGEWRWARSDGICAWPQAERQLAARPDGRHGTFFAHSGSLAGRPHVGLRVCV